MKYECWPILLWNMFAHNTVQLSLDWYEQIVSMDNHRSYSEDRLMPNVSNSSLIKIDQSQ